MTLAIRATFSFHGSSSELSDDSVSKFGTGYPHHGRADKDSYPHDGRANKDSYQHDRHKLTNTLC